MAASCFKLSFFAVIICCVPGWMYLFRMFKMSLPVVGSSSHRYRGNTTTVNGTGQSVSITRNVTETHQVFIVPTVCPDLPNITNLVSNREMDLGSSQPLSKSEQFCFGDQLDKVRITIARVNNEMPKLLAARSSRATAQKHVNRPIMESLSSLEVRLGDYMYLPGGYWRPATCKPRWKVAIVIPYRKRPEQLGTFLWFMVPFLKRQLLEFTFYVVNQEGSELFNRGLLFNVGFLESLNFSHWDCFVLHDVDHIPVSDFTPYGCVDMPRHFLGKSDEPKWALYPGAFGGVSGLTREQFKLVNGFSNKYWGWCCEDDDLNYRIAIKDLKNTRHKENIFFKVIKKSHHAGSRTRSKENQRLSEKNAIRRRQATDGLNSIVYDPPHLEFHTLYMNISVHLHK